MYNRDTYADAISFSPMYPSGFMTLAQGVEPSLPVNLNSSGYYASWAHLLSLNGISSPLFSLLPSNSALQAQYSPSLTSA